MPDFLLSVGADVNLSYEQMQKDISSLVSQLNNNPPKIKLSFDIDNSKTLSNLNNQINNNTKVIEENTQATHKKTSASKYANQATQENIITEKQLTQIQKSSITALAQGETALRNWTAAERSRNQSSRTAYDALRTNVAQLREARAKYNDTTDGVNKLQEAEQNVRVSLKKAGQVIKQNGDATKTWGERIGSLAQKFGNWLSVSQIMMQTIQGVKKMVTNVIDLDTAMTELKKVTNESDNTYNTFLEKSATRAKSLGSTISDTINASADFARLGYNLDEASSLADAAIVYKNVGDGIEDIGAASESIISTMKAFGVEASDSINIVDKFNEVGNNFAISSVGIGDALMRSASSLHAAGNDIDESIALVTAANSVIQNPDSVGTAMKTISMYLRAAKTEAEEAGESTDGMAESVSELRSKILSLTGNKVDIQVDENNFKSTYQIIKELSGVWDSLTDITQANILEMIGGKRNSNVVASLLENFDIAEDVVKSSANSAGSALTENEKVLDSIEGRLSVFKATFESLSNTFLSSGFLKGGLDIATNFVNILDVIIDKFGTMPILISGISTIGLFKNGSGLFGTFNEDLDTAIKGSSNLANQLGFLGVSLKDISTTLTSGIGIKGLGNLFSNSITEKDIGMLENYNKLIGDGIEPQKAMASSLIGCSKAARQMAVEAQGAKIDLATIGTVSQTSTFKLLALKAATTALNAAFSMGIGLLISGAVSGINYLIHYEDKLIEKSEDAANSIKSISDDLKNNTSIVDDIGKRFAELAQGVNQLTGANENLSNDEYKEFLNLSNQLAEIFPTLPRKYDENGNAIVNLSGDVDTIVGSLENLLNVQRQISNQQIADKLPDLYSGIITKSNNYNDEIEDYMHQREEIEDAYDKLTDNNFAKSFDSTIQGNMLYIQGAGKSLDELNLIADDYLAVLDELGIKYEYLSTEYEYDKGKMVDVPVGYNYHITDWDYMSDEEIDKQKAKISKGIQALAQKYSDEISNLNAKIQSTKNENKQNWNGLLSSISAWLSTENSYNVLSDNMQGVVQSMIDNVDFGKLNFSKWEDIENHIKTNLIYPISNSSPKVQESFSELFNIPTDKIPVDSYIREVKDKIKEISDNSDFKYDDLLKLTGYEDIIAKYEDNAKKIISGLDGVTEQEVKSLSPDELTKAFDYVTKYGIKSWDELKLALKSKIFDSPEAGLEDIQTLINKISAAKEALSSQSTGTSLSLEKFNSDELQDYTSALEYHNGVLQLNAEKVRDIIKAKSEEQIQTIKATKANAQSKYLENAAQIEKLRQKIKDKAYDEGESKKSTENNINALLEENSTIKAQCDSYDLMTASLQEATDAYHNWLNTQNAAQNGDMFDDTLNAINRIDETLNDSDSEYFGRVGRTDYKAALDLIIPDSIDSDDKKKINAYRKSIYDLFTYDDDGNYAGLNIENFCQKAVDKGLMVFDKSKDSYIIAGQKTMEDFAKGLNLSLPLVQAMFGEMEEFGGEFSWLDEYPKTIGDLGVAANEAAESLRQMKGNKDLNIRLDVSDIDDTDTKISTLEATIKEMQGVKGKANVDSSEVEYANQIIEYCVAQQQELNKPIVMSVDTSAISERNAEVITTIQNFKNACDTLELQQKLGVDTTEAQEKVNSLVNQVKQIDSSISTELKLDTSSIENLKASINNITGEQLVSIGIDDSAIDGWTDANKTATVTYDKDTTEIDSYNPKNLERTVTYHVKIDPSGLQSLNETGILDKTHIFLPKASGNNKLNGTAHINGTAMAGGNWGARQGGETLVGELGREIVVDPHTGRWYTVGDNGAEFANIPRGSIVFNHEQTESLLANGYVAGRASALASGTAMVTGGIKRNNAKSSKKSGGNSTSNYGKTKSSKDKSSSSKSSKSSDTAKDFEETFDWVEVAIDRVERAVSKLDLKAGNVYKSWSSRNKNLTKEISKISNEISLQQKGYKRYFNEAKSVNLESYLINKKGKSVRQAEKYVKKVQNGKIDINTVKDEKLADKIKEYQQWYNKALDCKDAIEKLKETEASLYKQRFDNIVTKYDNILAVIEHKESMLNEYINQAEEKGYITSTKYYEALIGSEINNISKLESEKASLINSMNQAVASGKITKGSEAWYEMAQQIDDVSLAITEANTNLIEYNNSIRDIKWQVFDTMQDRISNIAKESDFLIDLLSNKKLYDDRGQLTNEGTATMGLHASNYESYMAQAKKYAKEISSINGQLISDPYNQKLIERKEELLELQQEMISSAEDEKQSIVDMVEEGIELELSALKELIDTYTDALDAQKDLYDYQKKVADQTEEISSLQKQLSVYEGDTSEEAKQRIQKIKVALEEAKDNLKETEYDKYVSDQKKLLDDLYDEYESILNARLDDTNALISDMIETVNNHKTSISDTIDKAADDVGYTMSTSLDTIWDKDTGISKSVNYAIGDICKNTESMMTYLNKIANSSSTSASTSSVAETAPSAPKKASLKTGKYGSVWGDDIPQKGDKVTFKKGYNYFNSPTGGGKTKNTKKQTLYIAGINSASSSKYPYLLGTTPDNTKTKKMLGWVKKAAISGYATGIKKVPENEYAWTQEGRKSEAIVRPSDGAILTPLAKNDSVLSHNATSNLFDFANDPREFIRDTFDLNSIAPTPVCKNIGGNTFDNDISLQITLPNVTNYEQFKNAMQHDKSFEKMIQTMTVGKLSNDNMFKKYKS